MVGSGSNRGTDNNNNIEPVTSIIVAKGDGFIMAFVFLFIFFASIFLYGSYRLGVIEEKIGQLEDVVFVNGVYKGIK